MVLRYLSHQINTKHHSHFKLSLAVSAAIFASFSLEPQNAYANAAVFFTELDGDENVISEPTGNNTAFVNVGVTLTLTNIANWAQFDLGCDIDGRVSVFDFNTTEGLDYTLPTDLTFNVNLNATDESEISVVVDIPFEILADFETEENEFVDVEITDVEAVCGSSGGETADTFENRTSDVFISENNNGYGSSITITDTFNEGTEEPIIDNNIDEFPDEQASLKTQVQDITNLATHTGLLQTRRLGAELENIRKGKRGLNVNNLQVNVNGIHVPFNQWGYDKNNETKGAGAGDPLVDFGRWGMFVSGAIEIGEQKNTNNRDNEYDSSILLLGVDYQFNTNLVAGGALGYTSLKSETGNNIATTEFTKVNYFTFLSYYKEDFYFDAILGYGDTDYDLDRIVINDNLSATTNGDEINASIGAGYQFNLKRSLINIHALLNYVDVNVDAYNEQTDGIELTANVNNFSKQSFVSNIGVEYSFNINTSFAVIAPQFKLGWEHQFEGNAVTISGNFVGEEISQPFEIDTNILDQNYFTAQMGITATFPHGISSYITYDTYADRNDLSSEMYSFGIRGQF